MAYGFGIAAIDNHADHLKAVWHFDEASGNRADSVGTNTLVDVNTVTSRAGKNNLGAEFDDDLTEYLSLADNADISPTTGFAFSFWVYLDDADDHKIFLGKRESFYIGWFNNPSKFIMQLRKSGGDYANKAEMDGISATTLHHIVFMACDGFMRAYVDNVEVGDVAYDDTIFDSGYEFTVGFYAPHGEYHDGMMDEMSYYKDISFVDQAERDAFVDGYWNDGAGRFYQELPPDWYNENWLYRTAFQSQNAKVAEVVSNGYIDLSEFDTAYFWEHVKDGGGDIRITKADGVTEVAREVVSCDIGAETGEVHFDTTGIQTGSDVTWYLYHGNAGASDYARDAEFGLEAVWGVASKLVLHFQGDDGATAIIDSSASEHAVTLDNTAELDTAQKKVGTSCVLLDGPGNRVRIPAHVDLEPGTGPFTFSYWIRYNGTVPAIIYDADPTLGCYLEQGAISLTFHGRGIGDNRAVNFIPNENEWYCVAIVRIGDDLYFVINGVLQETPKDATGLDIRDIPDDITIGGWEHATAEGINGWIEEFHFLKGVGRSVNYLLTEYNNQDDPGTFWSVGAEEEVPVPEVSAARFLNVWIA